MKSCDWAFSFDHLKHPRHFRLPNYVRVGAGVNLIKRDVKPMRILQKKKRFCAFIYYNLNGQVRNLFFDLLSKYKRVDAPGRCRRNIPGFDNRPNMRGKGRYESKVRFLRNYKFAIAFENASYPGYTTEKLFHAMLANTIPIYWGNPVVHRDFNTKSFINYHDFKSIDKVIRRVIELDKDDGYYAKYMRQPWYPNNKLTPYVNPDRILKRFGQIFESR
jgi:hypothetical protein